MSIYVIRYGDLLKIGYSSDLQKRVRAILWGIPGGQATFVGHMPGDREVEAHLHLRFEGSRFSGEWFRETPELLAFCEIVLTREMPAAPDRQLGSRKSASTRASAEAKDKLRSFALVQWPGSTHDERVKKLAAHLGWMESRVRGFYHADARAVLRSTEASDLALLIAPELRSEPSDQQPKED